MSKCRKGFYRADIYSHGRSHNVGKFDSKRKGKGQPGCCFIVLKNNEVDCFFGHEAGEGQEFRVFAKNAFICNKRKLNELLGEFHELEWDIICFSETRAASDEKLLEKRHRLFTCSDENRFAGVGILVNCKLVDKIKAFHEVNGRLCGIDMMFGNLKFRILAVYMPQ